MPTKMVLDDQSVVATVDLLWYYRAHTQVQTHTYTKLHGYRCIYTMHDYNMASLLLLNRMFTLGIYT